MLSYNFARTLASEELQVTSVRLRGTQNLYLSPRSYQNRSTMSVADFLKEWQPYLDKEGVTVPFAGQEIFDDGLVQAIVWDLIPSPLRRLRINVRHFGALLAVPSTNSSGDSCWSQEEPSVSLREICDKEDEMRKKEGGASYLRRLSMQ